MWGPNHEHYGSYSKIAVFACVFGSVDVYLTPTAMKPTAVTKWSVLRKAIKSSVARASKLRPRVEAAAATATVHSDEPANIPSSPEDILREAELVAARLREFLARNRPQDPVQSRGQAFGEAMVCLMPIITSGYNAELFERMILNVLVEVVLKYVPDGFDTIFVHLQQVKGNVDGLHDKYPSAMQIFAGKSVATARVVKCMRWQLLAHLLQQVVALRYKDQPTLRHMTLTFANLLCEGCQ